MATKKAAPKNVIQTLSIGQVSRAEEKAGISISALEDPNALGKLDLLARLAYEVHKRDNENTAPYEVFENSKTIEDIMSILGLDSE